LEDTLGNIEIERNRLKRAGIWLWYNDITRVALLFGFPASVTLTAYLLFGCGEYLRDVCAVSLAVIVACMIFCGDYSNLRRIGLDEYRRKI